MQLKKLMNKTPHLIYWAILQFGLFCCLIFIMGIVHGGDLVFHSRIWIILLPVSLFTVLYVVVRGALWLRANGLKYSATVGEVDEAKKRREMDRPTR
jgi:hypothetical protein